MTKVTLFLVGIFAPICLLAKPFNESVSVTSSQTTTELNLTDGVQPLPEPRHFNDFLGKCFQRAFLGYTIKPLTKYGDNFGSTLLALEVKLSKSNDSNDIETLQLAVKAMHTGSITIPQLKQFAKEMHFYADIIPALEQFEAVANIPKSERIDAFARYFCSRLSLNPDVVSADTDALLLLENLKSINFESPNRWDRLNKNEMLTGLKNLAKLHALLVAMRRLQPNLFLAKVDPYLQNTYIVPYVDKIVKRIDTFIKKMPANFSNISPKLNTSIENAKTLYKNFHINTDRTPDTPYTTLYHSDLWTKNVMTNGGSANTPIQVKLLDFQPYFYGSFALDLTQFIFLNGRIDDLRTNFRSFIDFYFMEFVKMLQLSNCPLDDYTNEKMWNEIKEKAKISLVTIYTNLGIDNNFLLGDRNDDDPPPEVLLKRWKCVTDLYVENGFI